MVSSTTTSHPSAMPPTLRTLGFPTPERWSRAHAHALEGVHATSCTGSLASSVLSSVAELSSWDQWYKHPPLLSNGHVHTIVAAKMRRTRPVAYYRQLLTTPDGGTLALDLLAGVRRAAARRSAERWPRLRALARGAFIAGAEEDADGMDTAFVRQPPPLSPDRPMLLLASGLGGGSQDTYVRSMAAAAAERGWQVAVINMRACGNSPVTSPRLFSAYRCAPAARTSLDARARPSPALCAPPTSSPPALMHAHRGANDDVRTAVEWLRRERLGGGGVLAGLGWSNSGTILNNVLAEQATTHPGDGHRIDACAAIATPLNMPANSANLQRPFHKQVTAGSLRGCTVPRACRPPASPPLPPQVYDRNLGKSLRTLWAAARHQYLDPSTGEVRPVARWDGKGHFLVDDELASCANSIRELDEAVTRRQYGCAPRPHGRWSGRQSLLAVRCTGTRGSMRGRSVALAPAPARSATSRSTTTTRRHRVTSAFRRSRRRSCFSTRTMTRSCPDILCNGPWR